MSLKTAMKLRRKTAVLLVCDKTLAWAARLNQRRYFAAMSDARLDSAARRARMAERSVDARDIENLRMQCRQLIAQHRFDIIVHNEGLADAETETRAV